MNKIKTQFQVLLNNKGLIYCLLVFLISRGVYIIAWLMDISFPDKNPVNYWYTCNSFLESWCRWDSQWYLEIATQGYEFNSSSFAFFPLYPFMIRLLTYLGISPELAGIIISNISLFVAIYFLYKLIMLKWSDKIAQNTILYLILFPTAFFFSAIYTESLFLAVVILSFYFAEKKNYLLAGIFGMFASITRVAGLILIPCLLVKYFSERNWNWKKSDYNLIYILLISLGFIIYVIYQYFITGNPLAFISSQSTDAFGRYITFPLLPIFKSIASLIAGASFSSIRLLNLLVVIIFILIIILNWKKLPLEYNIYSVLSMLIPLTTTYNGDPLISFSRYTLVIFPVFISIGMLEVRPLIRNCLFMMLFTLQFIMIIKFVNWYWVA